MNRFYRVFPQAFTAMECAELNALALTKPGREATVVNYGKGEVSAKQRSALCRWLRAGDPDLYLWTLKLRDYMLEANAMNFGVDCQDFYNMQHTEYQAAAGGHHDWHEDCGWITHEHPSPFDRKLTAVIQMTPRDQYEGGELMVDRGGLKAGEFTEQGDLIVFPSFLKHRVAPVTRGVRHSLVAWMYGPRWR